MSDDPKYPLPYEEARLVLADQVGQMPDFIFNAVTDAMETMAHETQELKAILELIVIDLDRVLTEEALDQVTRDHLARALVMARRGIRGNLRTQPR